MKIYSGKVGDNIYTGNSQSLGAINPSTGRYNTQSEEEKYIPQFEETSQIDYSALSQSANGNRKSEEKPDLLSFGKQVYTTTCAACHQADGNGLPNVFPPVKNSDWVASRNKEELIDIISSGLNGKIKVNGKDYNNIMPPQNLNDSQIAAVLTYVYKEMNKSAKTVSEEEVKNSRNTKSMTGK